MGSAFTSAIPYFRDPATARCNGYQGDWLTLTVFPGGKTMTPEQKKANIKTGLILASVAVVFFIGFMVKMVVLGK